MPNIVGRSICPKSFRCSHCRARCCCRAGRCRSIFLSRVISLWSMIACAPFAGDFIARKGENEVDREAVLGALRSFMKANKLQADWEGIDQAPNEALVNALSMMSPYGAPEKQALLEAPDLKTRAELLVAITEIELAKKNTEGEPQLQ